MGFNLINIKAKEKKGGTNNGNIRRYMKLTTNDENSNTYSKLGWVTIVQSNRDKGNNQLGVKKSHQKEEYTGVWNKRVESLTSIIENLGVGKNVNIED